MNLDLKTALPQGLELLGSALAATGIGGGRRVRFSAASASWSATLSA